MMAQLIKLRQCVSRYEVDLRRYANRFIWLKNRRLNEWKQRAESSTLQDLDHQVKLGKEFTAWLYRIQLDWATRTSDQRSSCPEEIEGAEWIKRLLGEVNDIAFLIYRPVLLTQSAAVQLDSLIITNDTIWCVKPMSGENGSVFQEVSGRKWKEIVSGGEREVLNPLISLNRTRAVVDAFLKNRGIGMKIVSTAYAPDSYIEFVHEDAGESFVDFRNEREWFEMLSQHSLLMKRVQIEAAEALLNHFETIASPRFQNT